MFSPFPLQDSELNTETNWYVQLIMVIWIIQLCLCRNIGRIITRRNLSGTGTFMRSGVPKIATSWLVGSQCSYEYELSNVDCGQAGC